MLVLHRKIGQEIVLSHPALTTDITITVSDILTTHRVKLGIQAPKHVKIVRQELIEQAETKQGEASLDVWFKADREAAKHRTAPITKEYIEALEAIVRLSDQFWQAMNHHARTPEQNQLCDDLLNELSHVNFLAERDSIEEEDSQADEDALREIIWSQGGITYAAIV